MDLCESVINANGRTTVPKTVRDTLGLKPGDRVRYFIQDGEVRIRPVRSVRQLRGILNYDGPPVTLAEMERAISEGAAET